MGLSVPPAEVLGWTLTRDDQKFYVFLFIVVVCLKFLLRKG